MKRQNISDCASALRISFSVTLISVSAILLAIAAPTNTKIDSRQMTATGQASGITVPAIFTDASPTPTPTSCNSNKIAFTSTRDGNSEIYVMDASGSNQTRLTNNPAFDFSPSFSRDGSKIAFVSNRDGIPQIYVMNADGSNQTRLTNNPASADVSPSFSGDGSKIAFSSTRYGLDASTRDLRHERRRLQPNPADQQPFV